MEDNFFKFSRKTIERLVQQYKEQGLQKATMAGVHGDLERLKPEIEKIYREIVFASTMWVSDCAFFGWDWSKDDGRMESMKFITDSITEKFEEIYALILVGLDEQIT